ncbi:MAG: hypothetical protein LBS68_00110 [Puniceicoccales bacterium]|jgi:hypothetical protein|nr:hypothetical protein [Puniceicoccales bacterium]
MANSSLLFFAGFLPPVLLLSLIFWNPWSRESTLRVLRSPRINRAVFSLAAALFLWKVCNLDAADFGNYRHLLFSAFFLLALGALAFNHGFLAARGLAIFQLVWANEFLTAGLGHFSSPWLLAKAVAYVYILLAIYLVIYPYRLRNWLVWRSRR